MIVDLERFVATEEAYWHELEHMLHALETRMERSLTLEEAKRFHYLYERASSDLARLATFPSEPRLRHFLESIVARAYAEIHETRKKPHRFSPFKWFFGTFPQTFRRHIRIFALVLLITFAGTLFGGLAVALDPDAKRVLMPFAHLQLDPSERVAYEESQEEDRMRGRMSSFSAYLMTHNTKVSVFVLGLGITWGVGTLIMLFYNGVIIGAVVSDYILAGEGLFVAGWLLPHGSIEIPAVLIAGQAGLLLGKTLIGKGTSVSVSDRLRAVSSDLVTLLLGVAILLVWAGIVESFFSQYHEPVLPYPLKITFGLVELAGLVIFLAMSGRRMDDETAGRRSAAAVAPRFPE